MTKPIRQTQIRRGAGIALLVLAAAGAAVTARALALNEVRLWYAVLLVQTLALAAVAGVALLAVPPPGLARSTAPEA
jgi:hypothetical protein